MNLKSILSSISVGLLAVGIAPFANAQAPEAPEAESENPSGLRAHGGERYAIDHLFFFSDGFAPELAYAQQQGFLRWPFPNSHTGQGTTGAYIYFDNFYIEFLWVDDADAAAANASRAHSDFNVRNTWRENPSISPFGIGLRDYQEDEPSRFERNEYTADWMGGNFALYTTAGATNSAEPWTFFLPLEITGNARDDFGPQSSTRLEHPNGMRVLTGVRLVLPEGQEPSDTLIGLEEEGVIEIAHGDSHWVELTFDGGTQGETIDLRPMSPLVFHH